MDTPVTPDSLQRIVAELRAHAADQWTPNSALHTELADRLERLSAAEQKVMEWQPIETAPKDREILICGGFMQQECRGGPCAYSVVIAQWFDGQFNFYPEKRTVKGYWRVDDSDGDVGVHNPTHWQPLPRAACESQKSDVGGDGV